MQAVVHHPHHPARLLQGAALLQHQAWPEQRGRSPGKAAGCPCSEQSRGSGRSARGLLNLHQQALGVLEQSFSFPEPAVLRISANSIPYFRKITFL